MSTQGQLKNQQHTRPTPAAPAKSGYNFTLCPVPPTIKQVHVVVDGVRSGTYRILCVGALFPTSPGATIGDAKTYYLLELATHTLKGWFDVEQCFFDQSEAETEAARQRRAK